MARKSYATEEIIKHLRTMEIEKAKGKSTERYISLLSPFRTSLLERIENYFNWVQQSSFSMFLMCLAGTFPSSLYAHAITGLPPRVSFL